MILHSVAPRLAGSMPDLQDVDFMDVVLPASGRETIGLGCYYS